MALTDLYDLKPQIIPHLPGCPEALIQQVIREIAREFCLESGVWRETQDAAATTVADQAAYTLTVPSGYVAVYLRLNKVEVNDIEINETNWTFRPDHVLTFLTGSIPTVSSQNIDVEAEFLPTEACYQLPDWLVNRWQDAIVFGTVGQLKLMDEKPWYDPETGSMRYRQFLQRQNTAKREKMVNRQSGRRMVAAKRRFY